MSKLSYLTPTTWPHICRREFGMNFFWSKVGNFFWASVHERLRIKSGRRRQLCSCNQLSSEWSRSARLTCTCRLILYSCPAEMMWLALGQMNADNYYARSAWHYNPTDRRTSRHTIYMHINLLWDTCMYARCKWSSFTCVPFINDN